MDQIERLNFVKAIISSFFLLIGSWDFIYAEYVMAAGSHHRSIVWQVTQFSHMKIAFSSFLFLVERKI